jgi:hypothetical protein
LVGYGAGKCLPLSGRGKRIEVLVRMAVQFGEACPNDPPKIEESFFINLVSTEQFGVIAKITKKPGELPERTFRTVEASRKGERFKGSRFENGEANGEEGFLGMPTI